MKAEYLSEREFTLTPDGDPSTSDNDLYATGGEVDAQFEKGKTVIHVLHGKNGVRLVFNFEQFKHEIYVGLSPAEVDEFIHYLKNPPTA